VDREFWISELTDDDLPAVVTLCAGALDLPEAAAEAAEIVRRLRETTGTEGWAKSPRRLAAFVARDNESGLVGVVLGSISHRDPSIGHVDLIAVGKAERRRGVGRALLARLEGALAGLGADDVVLAGNAPYYAWPGIDVRYTPAICAAMALGFEEDQPAWNMTARVDELDLTVAPIPGISLRKAGDDDIDKVTEFATKHWGPTWAREIADSIGVHFATRDGATTGDGEVLGFAAYGARPHWFGPMGTAPAAQGLGVGAALLRRCLADQRAGGLREVQIGWVGPMPFYSRVIGARVERVFFTYRKQI
jgi:mycothiol synthase